MRKFDVTKAADRRRFFLERGMSKMPRGAGSDLSYLLTFSTASGVSSSMKALLESVPAMLIGAQAAAIYAPPRHTDDIDYLVPHERFSEAEDELRNVGWQRLRSLVFPNAMLGLYGSAWKQGGAQSQELDLIATAQDWATEAFAAPPVRNKAGERIIPLAYLSLMKLDAARTVDQADLSRMLGRLSQSGIEDVIAIVERHYGDPSAADDLRQYAQLGRWEYEQTDAPGQ